jgi:hypothetical protein
VKRQHRPLSSREWEKVTSRRPVVKRVPRPGKPHSPGPSGPEEIAFELAKVRYARRVVKDANGDPAKGDEVLGALRELREEA